MNILENLKYSVDHEWIKVEGDEAYIGITAFAADQLGDIVFVDINTVGETLDQNEVFGSIEAVKTVSDLMLPVSGEILEFNEALEAEPSLINTDCYGKGWIVKIMLTNPSQLDNLIDAAAYKALIGA